MSRGGARVNSGPVAKKPRKRVLVPGFLRNSAPSSEPAELKADDGITPKDYLLGIVRGTIEFDEPKFRAAVAVAPYCHPRIEKAVQSKKEEAAQDAKSAAVGKFATPPAPKLIVNNA